MKVSGPSLYMTYLLKELLEGHIEVTVQPGLVRVMKTFSFPITEVTGNNTPITNIID